MISNLLAYLTGQNLSNEIANFDHLSLNWSYSSYSGIIGPMLIE